MEQLEELARDEFERKQMELENMEDDEDAEEAEDTFEELPEETYAQLSYFILLCYDCCWISFPFFL
jgi:hypothetical protein